MNCAKLGANPASIHNSQVYLVFVRNATVDNQENSFVRRLAVSKGAVNGLYLGATMSGKGKDFGWVDGTEWDYANFHQGIIVLLSSREYSAQDSQWMGWVSVWPWIRQVPPVSG